MYQVTLNYYIIVVNQLVLFFVNKMCFYWKHDYENDQKKP